MRPSRTFPIERPKFGQRGLKPEENFRLTRVIRGHALWPTACFPLRLFSATASA